MLGDQQPVLPALGGREVHAGRPTASIAGIGRGGREVHAGRPTASGCNGGRPVLDSCTNLMFYHVNTHVTTQERLTG